MSAVVVMKQQNVKHYPVSPVPTVTVALSKVKMPPSGDGLEVTLTV